LIEFVHSLLLAPVRMLFHTQFVIAALTGWRLDWKSPPRDDAATSWREATARHGVHTILAVVWIAAILATSAAFPWWLSPILAGLLLAIPLSVYTSRVKIGRALRSRGLMLTPEETREPRVLREARRAAAAVGERMASLRNALADRAIQQRVVAALPPRAAASGAKGDAEAARIERALRDGPEAVARDDGLRLLSSCAALAVLHREVVAGRSHPDWRPVHEEVIDAAAVTKMPTPSESDQGHAAVTSDRKHATESL
jgi:membrane glycosyltransferase